MIITEIHPSDKGKSAEAILEAATEQAIECGAEEVNLLDEETLEFICGSTNLRAVRDALEKAKYTISSASVEYIPLQLQKLSDSEMELCDKLFKKLDEMPEVVKISNNIA